MMLGERGVETQAEPIAVTAREVKWFFPWSVRSWRRLDSGGKTPRGRRVGGLKMWLVDDLRLWARWDFPERSVFEARLARLKSEHDSGARRA